MYVSWCHLLVGPDVCFLMLPLSRLRRMYGYYLLVGSGVCNLAIMSLLHHCCYSHIVSFALYYISMGSLIKSNID